MGGVNVAHSGTVVGLLFESGGRLAIQHAREEIPGENRVTPRAFGVVRSLVDTLPFIDKKVPCTMQERMMP